MEYIKKDEGIRQLLEIAISCGRSWQSPQTGYIHYYYQEREEKEHHAIPLYENILLVLALFRSHLHENIVEAKQILDRLLFFQNTVSEEAFGNFPVYLHEYPLCKDRKLGALLLAPLSMIFLEFHFVLGQDLKHRLEKSLQHLLLFCLKTQNERSFSYSLLLRVAASFVRVGEFIEDKHLVKQGWDMEKSLRNFHPLNPSAASPAALADMLVGLQMLYKELSKSPWAPFWDYLNHLWQEECFAYIGPGLKECQLREEPEVTLFDYFAGYFSGSFAFRSFRDHPIQLQAALVVPSLDRFSKKPFFLYETQVNDQRCFLQKEQGCALAVLEKQADSAVFSKYYYPVKWVFGDRNLTRVYGMQGGNCRTIRATGSLKQLVIEVELGETINTEERDKQREVSFYVTHEEGLIFSVEGKRATVFHLGETLTAQGALACFSFRFELVKGSGEFLGHVMKGNRPAQIGLTKDHYFDAFDWQIFIRTIQRSAQCHFKVYVDIQLVT